MRTNFRLHDGVRICHLDFSHIPNEAEALVAIAEAKRVIAREPKASVYTITNVTGSRVTKTLRDALYDLTQHNKPYVRFGAVVGVTAIQRVILRAIIQLTGRKLHAAETMADAVAAVVKEAKSGAS
ncbi:MAG: hypothetical protein ABIY52_04665 [Gemmatimonadaceae bacterium]